MAIVTSDREEPLVELVRFSNLDDAILAQGRLQADGIEAFVDDRSFSVLPVLSSGRPQVRVLVAPTDLEQGLRSLGTDHGSDLDEIAEASLAPGINETCPRCGSDRLMMRRFLLPRSPWAAGAAAVAAVFLFRVLGVGIPSLVGLAAVLYAINLVAGPTMECKTCHHRWQVRSEP